MSWTTQCTAPYIIGIHSSIYSRMNKNELGDVVIVNIDNRTIQSPYNDLSRFPKHLIQPMKKDIQQSSQLVGDNFARIFLRTMAFILGNYPSGFVIINNKLDFNRDEYLKQYVGTDLDKFMSSIANTQMFEQVNAKQKKELIQRKEIFVYLSFLAIELIYNLNENLMLMNLILKLKILNNQKK